MTALFALEILQKQNQQVILIFSNDVPNHRSENKTNRLIGTIWQRTFWHIDKTCIRTIKQSPIFASIEVQGCLYLKKTSIYAKFVQTLRISRHSHIRIIYFETHARKIGQRSDRQGCDSAKFKMA